MANMSTKRKTPVRQAFGSRNPSEAQSTVRSRSKTRRDPVKQEAKRQRRENPTPLRRALNGGKTLLALFVWAAVSPAQVVAVAPYIGYAYAQSVLVSFALMSAILLHLWPTKTPQWRTLFWAFWITGGIGTVLLFSGMGPMALTIATLAAFVFVLLRMNQNGRKLVGMIQDWRMLR